MARMIGFQLQLDPQHWSALFSFDLILSKCFAYCSHVYYFIFSPLCQGLTQTLPCLTTCDLASYETEYQKYVFWRLSRSSLLSPAYSFKGTLPSTLLGSLGRHPLVYSRPIFINYHLFLYLSQLSFPVFSTDYCLSFIAPQIINTDLEYWGKIYSRINAMW